MRGRAVACLAAGLIALAPPGFSAPAAAEPFILAEPLAAVGRANHAGYARRRHCTMFAIAPRTVVTATHCLAGVDPARMQLLFGYARMRWERHTSPRTARDLGNDVAVLCLAQDAPDALVAAPGEVARGDPVRVIGYGQPRAHVQSADVCRVLAILGGELHLDCPQSRGASGGPVVNEEGEVVAVMSRTGRARSVASALPPRAARLCR